MDSMVIKGKNYKLVWNDEFDKNSIHYGPFGEAASSPEKWQITGMMGYYPDFYIPRDVEDIKKYSYTENGELVLKAGMFDWSKYNVGDDTYTGRKVTEELKYANGGVLATHNTMVYRKGYAEIRAKLPFNNSAWPAWWTRSTGSPLIKYEEFGGTDYTDPVYTFEIDMIECWAHLGEYVYPNIHKWYKNHFVSDGTTDRKGYGKVFDYDGNDVTDQIDKDVVNIEYNGEGKATQFTANIGGIYRKTGASRRYPLENANDYHTYGFLWTDEEMTFSIDGVDYYTLDLTKEFDGYHDGKYGWNQYMYFIFDNHIMTPMASWGGPPEKRFGGSGDTSDVEMRVDYIRLYQEEGKEDIITK